MTFTKTTRIGINDFIDLWDNVHNGDFDKIFGDLDDKIKKIWKKTIAERFQERKLNDRQTYGTITPQDIKIAIKMADSPQADISGILPKEPYRRWTDEEAMMEYYRNHPLKLKKWGELENKMASFSYYQSLLDQKIEVVVKVPRKTDYEIDPDPETYEKMEAWRSFIGSSLAIALPEIIGMIMDEIK